jgi:cytochrome c-type biogenesis protein CcmH
MNFSFWVGMLAMLLVAIVILVVPLLKVRNKGSIAYKDSNILLHEEKLEELDADLAEDRIDQAQYKIARQELDRELLADVPAESADTATLHYSKEASRQPALALAITVFLPTLALLVYLQLGMHAETETHAGMQTATNNAANQTLPTVEEMTAKLENKLRTEGGSVEEWAMLGRAYKHLGQFSESAEAFATAGEITPNAQLMLEQAEALALLNGQKFDIKGRELTLDALKLEPDNVNGLWFAGVAEFQFGNYRQSISHLSKLASVAEADDEIKQSIRFYIEQAREQLIAMGESVPPIEEILPVVAVVPEKSTGNAVELSVMIDVSDEVRQKFSGSDAVFVYAKAAQGPKVPLAAQRMTLAELPATVVLNDNMAMVEGMNLSAFPSVVVSARVTKSGSAIAQSGDYIGQVAVEDVASSDGLKITVATIVP